MSCATVGTPMDILRAVSPEGAKTYLDHKAAVTDNPQLQAVPQKYKLLVGIGVAAAFQSSTCTLMWTKQARQAGATDATDAEIAEALAWLGSEKK